VRRILALAALALLPAGSALAGGFSFSTSFTPRALGDLADAFGAAIAFPNLATAAASGVAGFDVLAVAGGPQVDTGASWWRSAVDARTIGGILPSYRAIVRKRLPGGVDIGAQFGRVAGEEYWGGELRYNVWDGGVVAPAGAVRLAYARLTGSAVALDVTEAQVVVSKGFTVVSPYVAAGYGRTAAEARFGDPVPMRRSVRHDRWSGVVGVRLAIAPFVHLAAEARRGTATSVAVGVGVGL
jgi:hypothetical protein